jgi:hypothetical protein
MADLNLDPYYFHERKTKRLVGLLGKGAEVLPLRLWTEHALSRAMDGRLTDLSPAEIEAMVDWWGKPGEMVSAMVAIRFLDRDGDTYVIHHWDQRQGHLNLFHQRAITAANVRWSKSSKKKPCSSNGQAMPKHENSNAPSEPSEPSEPTPPNPPSGDGDSSAEAEVESEARTFAVNWLTVNHAQYLRRACTESMKRLVIRLGKEEATDRVTKLIRDKPHVANPFAYLETTLDSETLKSAAKSEKYKDPPPFDPEQ